MKFSFILLLVFLLGSSMGYAETKTNPELKAKVEVDTYYDYPYEFYRFELFYDSENENYTSVYSSGITQEIRKENPVVTQTHSLEEGQNILLEIERLSNLDGLPDDEYPWGKQDLFVIYLPSQKSRMFTSKRGKEFPGILAFKKELPVTFVGRLFEKSGMKLVEGVTTL